MADPKAIAMQILGPPSGAPSSPNSPGESLEGGPTISPDDAAAITEASQGLMSSDPENVLAAFQVLLALAQR